MKRSARIQPCVPPIDGNHEAAFMSLDVRCDRQSDIHRPTEPLTGAWVGRTTDRFSAHYLNLQQDGDYITGMACYFESYWGWRYRAAPVIGRYPYVSYVITETSACDVPLCAGWVGVNWSGRVDGSGDIVSTRKNGLRFIRIANVPAA
jgi:hypothetical protein